ncbi:MAG: hypothetical protein E7269_07925 [Lachnospiraceae bacterium]|nr:hypothetical protein [Lachnospiraceae bacterium]
MKRLECKKRIWKFISSIIVFTIVIILACPKQEKYVSAQMDNEIQMLRCEDDYSEQSLTYIYAMLQGVEPENEKNFKVADYLSAYNADTDKIFYLYPIYDGEACAYIAHVDDAGNVVISSDTTVYDNLTQLEEGEDYLLYVTGGVYYAQDDDEIIKIDEVDSVEQQLDTEYGNLPYEEKIDNFGKIAGSDAVFVNLADENDVLLNTATCNMASERSFAMRATTPETVVKKCGITDFVLQGPYGLCWAASVATIANYERGLSFSAMTVANAMQIGFDDGANAIECQTALNRFALGTYSIYDDKLAWTSVKSNINNDNPFMMLLYGTDNNGNDVGHAITGYGYSCILGDLAGYSAYRMLYAWDSNNYQLILLYNSPTIVTSGYTFEWQVSIDRD